MFLTLLIVRQYNETEFTEVRRVFEESFDIRFQKGYVLNYLNFLICLSPLGLSVDPADHIIELVD